MAELADALEQSAARLAAAIRRFGDYRWVGIYEVSAEEIGVVGWDGPGPPAHPRFPRTEGRCGAAVHGQHSDRWGCRRRPSVPNDNQGGIVPPSVHMFGRRWKRWPGRCSSPSASGCRCKGARCMTAQQWTHRKLSSSPRMPGLVRLQVRSVVRP